MNVFTTIRNWMNGVRFYIGVGIGLVTLEVFWWGQEAFGGSNLATIRIQEVYAWLSLGLLAVALLIGPVTKAVPAVPGKRMLRESRRLFGIGAAWFAFLHAAVAYTGQLQLSNPLQLPKVYQQSLLLGAIGLLALLMLAFTSVNAIMKAWGVWWFRLHRLIYVTALAAMMHAFMVGAHATSTVALVGLGMVAAGWIGLNLYLLLRDAAAPTVWKILALSYGTILLLAVLNYGLTQHLGYNVLVSGHSSGHAVHTGAGRH